MKMDELQRNRAAFKGSVLRLLRDPNLSYREIGEQVGVSQWRVCQIRKEFGLPNRIGRRRPRTAPIPGLGINAAEAGDETEKGEDKDDSCG